MTRTHSTSCSTLLLALAISLGGGGRLAAQGQSAEDGNRALAAAFERT
jgi:hypothetical protein